MVSFDPNLLAHPRGEAWCLAQSLCDTGKFANPFAALDTGPSAHLAPVFPAFLAILMKIFGKSTFIGALAGALVVSFQLALYPVFSRMLGMGEINGIIAASIWIVAKPGVAWLWEAHYVAILVAVACCCYRRYLDEETRARRKLAWILGALMGFSILTSPTVAPIYATWLAWEMWYHKSAFFKKSLLPLVLLPVVIIAPWTIRNYLVLHSFPIIRDNFGLELSVSNNDCARATMRANFESGCFAEFHPYDNVNEARKVMEMGEVKYNELQLREALRWISSHPARFTKLSIMRLIAFWMPTDNFTIHYAGRWHRLERGTVYLMTLLSGSGLVVLYRRDPKSAAVLIPCLTAFPFVYYVVQSSDRYRYPIMWVTFLLGALPITACAQRLWLSRIGIE